MRLTIFGFFVQWLAPKPKHDKTGYLLGDVSMSAHFMKASHEIEVDKWCAFAMSVSTLCVHMGMQTEWEGEEGGGIGIGEWQCGQAGGPLASRILERMTNEGVSLVGALYVHTFLRFE